MEMNFLVPKTKAGEFLDQLSNLSVLKKRRIRWSLFLKQVWNRAHGKFDTKLFVGVNGRQKQDLPKEELEIWERAFPA